MSRIRILYIGPIPPEVGGQNAGGIATHCWQLAAHAYKRGYEVYILANTASSFEKDGIRVVNLPQRNKSCKVFYGLKFWLTSNNKGEFNALSFLSFKEKVNVLYRAYFLQKIINLVKPDLIHIHSLHNIQTLSLNLLRNLLPLVITDHGFWQCIYRKKDLEKIRKTVNGKDCIICVSYFSKKQIQNYKLVPFNKIEVIHNPIDINKIPLLDRGKVSEELGLRDKKIILFCGVVEPVKRKGLDILLKAVAINRCLKEKCKVIVITNEEGINYTRRFIQQKKINVLLLNPQPWEKIVKFYNVANVFVMPSKSESFGIVYEESLLVGIPIVGFYPILNELEHLLGIYIGEKFDANKEDEKALAEKIIKILKTDFNRELLRKKVIENLSWDVKFTEFDSVYREVLAK